MIKHHLQRVVQFSTLAVFLLVAACGDDPAAPEIHPEAEQVQLRVGDVILANATVAQSFNAITILRTVQAPLDVVFVDAIGNPLIHGSDEFLEVQIASGSIVSWEPDSPGAFSGSFTGLSEGTTTVVFRLIHGSGNNAHADFVPAPIQFNVTLQ